MHLGERYLGLNVDHEAYAFNVRRVSEPNVERDAAWSYEGQLLAMSGHLHLYGNHFFSV